MEKSNSKFESKEILLPEISNNNQNQFHISKLALTSHKN